MTEYKKYFNQGSDFLRLCVRRYGDVDLTETSEEHSEILCKHDLTKIFIRYVELYIHRVAEEARAPLMTDPETLAVLDSWAQRIFSEATA